MSSPRPLQVVYASVSAGGGHHTVRDALYRATVAADPKGERVQASRWTTEAGFDRFYRWCVKHGVQGLVYWPTRIFSLSAWVAALLTPALIRETAQLMRSNPPDVLVCTHVGLTAAALIARWWTGAPTRVVGVIPDYGVADVGFFPRFAFLRPHATWVNGEDTFRELNASGRAKPGEVHLLGTAVTEDFSAVRAERHAAGSKTPALKARWRDALQADWPEVARLDLTLPVVAFYGGSGFAGAARPVAETLLADETLRGKLNVVVLCGRDDELRASLQAAHGDRPGFAALGFMPHSQLAALYALTDVPVMGSLAHSTLQELLEVGVGPVLVHRVIPGTEPPYLDYLARERLGLYEPDVARMAAVVRSAVGLAGDPRWQPLAEGFLARAWGLRDASLGRSGRILEQLVHVTAPQALGSGVEDTLPVQ